MVVSSYALSCCRHHAALQTENPLIDTVQIPLDTVQIPQATSIIGIEEVHRSLGPVGVANDFKKLLELFLGQGDLSMAVFANDFMEAVIATPVARAKKPQKTDSAKVKDYVRSLKNSIPDTDQFREILDRMAAPRKVTKAELVLIAEQFLGYQENYKTKGQAVEALRVWQLHNAIQKSQDRASVEV